MSQEEMPKTDQAPEPGKINVPILDLPSREERRSITKTGRSLDGTLVHPDSQKNLRTATIVDLLAFGSEVNKANAALNAKIDDSLKMLADETSLGFKEVHWNFATFLSFLGTLKIIPEDFLTQYEVFKQKAEEELMKATEAMIKKQEEEAAAKVAEAPAPEVK